MAGKYFNSSSHFRSAYCTAGFAMAGTLQTDCLMPGFYTIDFLFIFHQ
jgi:hypothetical protein